MKKKSIISPTRRIKPLAKKAAARGRNRRQIAKERTVIRKSTKARTDKEKALIKAGKMYTFFSEHSTEGAWLYNFTTEKYLDENGEWVEEPDDDIKIVSEEINEGVRILQRVCTTDRIIIVTP